MMIATRVLDVISPANPVPKVDGLLAFEFSEQFSAERGAVNVHPSPFAASGWAMMCRGSGVAPGFAVSREVRARRRFGPDSRGGSCGWSSGLTLVTWCLPGWWGLSELAADALRLSTLPLGLGWYTVRVAAPTTADWSPGLPRDHRERLCLHRLWQRALWYSHSSTPSRRYRSTGSHSG